MEGTEGNKHASLLHYGAYYCCKKIYDEGPSPGKAKRVDKKPIK